MLPAPVKNRAKGLKKQLNFIRKLQAYVFSKVALYGFLAPVLGLTAAVSALDTNAIVGDLQRTVLTQPEQAGYLTATIQPLTTQDNSLLPTNNLLSTEELVTKQVRILATAYSSSIWETDSTPFITASGAYVHEGIVASNLLPFGTKLRIPELFGQKIFVVEDRLHARKGNYQIDIWFPSRQEALDFGAKYTYIELVD